LIIYLSLLCATILCTFSCSTEEDPTTEETVDRENNPEDEDTEYEDPGDDDLDTNSQDLEYENMVGIDFSGSNATITNQFDGKGVTVQNNNGHIVIKSTITDKELNYVLSGTTDNGSVKIYGEYKFNLYLNGVGITNPTGAAINIQCGKKISVTLVEATTNRLVDGETYTEVNGEDMKGTFFSEGQLTFNGTGTLEVRGKYKHAICTDDYFQINNGNIVIKEAVSDAIHAKDYAQISGGTITSRSVGEGIDSDGYILVEGGTLDITTTGKKGHGLKTGEYITIDSNGAINITAKGTAAKCLNSDTDISILKGNLILETTGSAYYDTDDADISSAAGIKCNGNLVIESGNITINSSGTGGKGINVDGTLTIHNGVIAVTTTGGQYTYDRNNDTAAKAIKSDGNLTINDGTITVRTSGIEAEGLESKATLAIRGGEIDIEAYDDAINASNHIEFSGGKTYCYSTANDAVDSNGTLTISGGTVIAAGATQPEGGIDCDNNRFAITGGTVISVGGSTSNPTANVCTQYSVVYNTTGSNIEIVHVESTSDSKEVFTFKMPRKYNSQMVMLFTSPSLEKNTGYTIYTGGSISGGTDFHGLYSGATYTIGTSAATFTTSSVVTTIGSSGGMGGGGFPGGGGRP
jgi:hypothetical protein